MLETLEPEFFRDTVNDQAAEMKCEHQYFKAMDQSSGGEAARRLQKDIIRDMVPKVKAMEPLRAEMVRLQRLWELHKAEGADHQLQGTSRMRDRAEASHQRFLEAKVRYDNELAKVWNGRDPAVIAFVDAWRAQMLSATDANLEQLLNDATEPSTDSMFRSKKAFNTMVVQEKIERAAEAVEGYGDAKEHLRGGGQLSDRQKAELMSSGAALHFLNKSPKYQSTFAGRDASMKGEFACMLEGKYGEGREAVMTTGNVVLLVGTGMTGAVVKGVVKKLLGVAISSMTATLAVGTAFAVAWNCDNGPDLKAVQTGNVCQQLQEGKSTNLELVSKDLATRMSVCGGEVAMASMGSLQFVKYGSLLRKMTSADDAIATVGRLNNMAGTKLRAALNSPTNGAALRARLQQATEGELKELTEKLTSCASNPRCESDLLSGFAASRPAQAVSNAAAQAASTADNAPPAPPPINTARVNELQKQSTRTLSDAIDNRPPGGADPNDIAALWKKDRGYFEMKLDDFEGHAINLYNKAVAEANPAKKQELLQKSRATAERAHQMARTITDSSSLSYSYESQATRIKRWIDGTFE